MAAGPRLRAYLALERAMVDLDDAGDPVGDELRDRMDPIWLKLSEEDRNALDFRIGDPSRFAGTLGPPLGEQISSDSMPEGDKICAVEKSMHVVFEILALWDREAGVWVAESEDVPGLVAEADSPKVLAQKLRTLIPQLLELSGFSNDKAACFHVRYRHEDSEVLTF